VSTPRPKKIFIKTQSLRIGFSEVTASWQWYKIEPHAVHINTRVFYWRKEEYDCLCCTCLHLGACACLVIWFDEVRNRIFWSFYWAPLLLSRRYVHIFTLGTELCYIFVWLGRAENKQLHKSEQTADDLVGYIRHSQGTRNSFVCERWAGTGEV